MVKRVRAVGQALVEFALAATLIFLLLAATVDLGMILFILQGLHSAAQEGALYGSLMRYEDTEDKDGDGFEKRDVYYYNADTDELVPVSQTTLLGHNDPPPNYGDFNSVENGSFYPDFIKQVRERVVYEAGPGGTTGFSNLHDLDGDGVDDGVQAPTEAIVSAGSKPGWFDTAESWKNNCEDWEEDRDYKEKCRLTPVETRRDELIEVNIEDVKKRESGVPVKTAACEDPMHFESNCQITVKVHARYEIIFPLMPAFGDEIWLSSEYTMLMNKSGVSRVGNPLEGDYRSFTPAALTPTEVITPTATPTPILYCETLFGGSPHVDNPPWTDGHVPADVEGDSVTVADSDWNVDMCSAGLGPEGTYDEFHYLYERREDPDHKNVIFSGKLTDWTPPIQDDEEGVMGLMIRNTTTPDSPFAMVAFKTTKDDNSNKVLFQYRVNKGGHILGGSDTGNDLILLGSAGPPPGGDALWLRLQRSNSRIRASYALAEPVDEDDWEHLGDWKDIDLYSDAALFGTFHASGLQIGSDEQFALASFKDVKFEEDSSPRPELYFKVPQDGYPIHTETVSMTDFTVGVSTLTETAPVEFDRVVYRLFDSQGNQLPFLGAGGGTEIEFTGPEMSCPAGSTDSDCSPPDMLCPFGMKAAGPPVECNDMPQELYDSLLRRTGVYRSSYINDHYIIKVDAFLEENGMPFSGESLFFVEPPSIEFEYPEYDILANNGTIPTDFRLEAYDPRYGSSNGAGLINAHYAIKYKPETPGGKWQEGWIYNSYGTMGARTTAGNILCLFGGTAPDTCNSWTPSLPEGDFTPAWDAPFDLNGNDVLDAGEDGYLMSYEQLLRGSYYLWARVLPRGGDYSDYNSWADDPPGPWSGFANLRVVTIPAPEIAFIKGGNPWDASETPELNDLEIDDAIFKVEAWAPHVGLTNGAGIESVEMIIYDSAGDPVHTRELSSAPFCLFDTGAHADAEGCTSMPQDFYNEQSSGEYKLFVRITNNAKTAYDYWIQGERSFTIPEANVHVDFIEPDASGFDQTEAENNIILSRNMVNYRFQAYVAEDPAPGYVGDADDGLNIEKVQIRITYADDTVDDQEYEVPAGISKPFCNLFESPPGGAPCEPMSEALYDSAKMQSGGAVKIEVRAKATAASLGNGRWSNWVTLDLEIPPMLIRFVDPKPNPTTGDVEEGYYDENDRKIISYREDSADGEDDDDGTEFEFEAFAPRYTGSVAGCDLSSITDFEGLDLENDVPEACWGSGIADYAVTINDPDGVDFYSNQDTYYVTYPPGDDPCNDDDLSTPCEEEARGLCVFGRDGDECKPMGENSDDGGDDDVLTFERLIRGDYEILATACEPAPGGCTDLLDPNAIARFKIGDIFVEFYHPPETDIFDVDDVEEDTEFELLAYDPIGGSDRKVDYLEVSIFDPSGTEVYSRSIYSGGNDRETDETDEHGGAYYCVFPDGGSDDTIIPCMPMTQALSDTLIPGTYTIRGTAYGINGDTEPAEAKFKVIIDMPITLEFIEKLGETPPITVTNVGETAFEAEAYRGLMLPPNGHGIKQVNFEINGPDIPLIGTGIVAPTNDEEAPYCVFGDTTGFCNQMDSDLFDILPGGTYEVKATATGFDDGDPDNIVMETVEFGISSFNPTFDFTGGASQVFTATDHVDWEVDVTVAPPLNINQVSARFVLWDVSGPEPVLLTSVENVEAFDIAGDSASFCLTTNDDHAIPAGECLKLDTPALAINTDYAMTALVVYQDGRRSTDIKRMDFRVQP